MTKIVNLTPHVIRLNDGREILPGSEIACGDFMGAPLRGASFRGCTLVACSFSEAVLVRADFSGAVLRRCTFNGANLRLASFRLATLSECSFVSALADRAQFDGAVVLGCDFSGASMVEAHMGGVRLDLSDYSRSHITARGFSAGLVGEQKLAALMSEAADYVARLRAADLPSALRAAFEGREPFITAVADQGCRAWRRRVILRALQDRLARAT